MPQIQLRVYAPRKGLIARDRQLVHRFLADGYLITDLVALDEQGNHTFTKADVVFTQGVSLSEGVLKFIGPWEAHPATLQLWLPLADALHQFIGAHDFAQSQLLMCIELEAPAASGGPTLHFVGGGEELWWHTEKAESLPASVEWVAPEPSEA